MQNPELYVSDAISKYLDFKRIKNSTRQDMLNSIGPYGFAREIATIHVNLGRQSGKTFFVNTKAGADDVVIVPPNHVRHHQGSLYRVFSASPQTVQRLRGVTFKTLYVDELRHCVENGLNVDELYSVLRSVDQIFVFLGE